MVSFVRSCQICSRVPEILDFHQHWNKFLLLHILASVLDLTHSNRCIVVSHCLPLPNGRWKRFPGGSAVKNLLAVQELQETWVLSLGQEDPLEKDMATHSSILAWRIPWTEEPSGLQSMGLQRVRHDWSDLAMADGVWSFHMPSKYLVWWV